MDNIFHTQTERNGDIIGKFVNRERGRFEARHNNMFAFSFTEVQNYTAFLAIICARHLLLIDRMQQHNQQLAKIFKNLPTRGVLGEEQVRQIEMAAAMQRELRLEVESFYLFAKIALDKLSHGVELYFGQGRGCSLDSHDDFLKHIKAYCLLKGLIMPNVLFETASKMKVDISDFRDYQISHHKSPRTLRMAGIDMNGKAKVTLMQLYPTHKDNDVESRDVSELFTDIMDYIERIIGWIESSSDKTALTIRSAN